MDSLDKSWHNICKTIVLNQMLFLKVIKNVNIHFVVDVYGDWVVKPHHLWSIFQFMQIHVAAILHNFQIKNIITFVHSQKVNLLECKFAKYVENIMHKHMLTTKWLYCENCVMAQSSLMRIVYIYIVVRVPSSHEVQSCWQHHIACSTSVIGAGSTNLSGLL